MSLKNKLSSWRKQVIEVPKRTTKTINFFDTKPNMIFVQNNYSLPIYVSLDSIPTLNKHDYKINPNYGKCVGRPYGTQQFYVMNNTDIDMTVPIWSIADEFDFSILQDFSIDELNLGNESLEALKSDGIVKGFADGVMLPRGTNEIGSVKILEDSLNYLINKIGGNNGYSNIGTLGKIESYCDHVKGDVLGILNNLKGFLSVKPSTEYDYSFVKNIEKIIDAINNKEITCNVQSIEACPIENILKTREQNHIVGNSSSSDRLIHIKKFTVSESKVTFQITNGTNVKDSFALDFSEGITEISDIKIPIPVGYYYNLISGNGSDDRAVYTLFAEVYEV